MTRKHFRAIAQTLAWHNQHATNDSERHVIKSIAEDLASICALTNEHFDHNRFLAACEPKPTPAKTATR